MIDWYYDKLPGPEFSNALQSLRDQGDVVAASGLAGKLPLFYIVGHSALAQAFRDGEHFPPGHAYQIFSLSLPPNIKSIDHW